MEHMGFEVESHSGSVIQIIPSHGVFGDLMDLFTLTREKAVKRGKPGSLDQLRNPGLPNVSGKADSREEGPCTAQANHLRAGSVPKIFGNAFGVDSQGHKYHTQIRFMYIYAMHLYVFH